MGAPTDPIDKLLDWIDGHHCDPPKYAPRWDADPLVIANGWLDGRCGICGTPIDARTPAPSLPADHTTTSEENRP